MRFTDLFICEAVELILDNNIFHFNAEHVKQTKGTAMGTKFAPSYANLVLAYLEEQMYQNLENTQNVEYARFIKDNFLRYLDDCFIVWDHKYDLNTFNQCLNSLNSNLKFKVETSTQEIRFLDIKVNLLNNCVTTDIYYKATDSHQYLQFNSCHPRHTKNNIPYSQAIRLCTIIDDPHVRDQRLADMAQYFISCGYPKSLVQDSIDKARRIPQKELRKVKDKPKKDVLAFVSTHNPNNPNVWPFVNNTMEIHKTYDKLAKALKETTIINSKRQPHNLKSILTKACFTNKNVLGGSFKCNDQRCATCPHIKETSTINITSTGEKFVIKKPMNCKSKNVLYIITCKTCKEQYVGLTNTNLNRRMTVHREQIKHRKYRQLGVSQHLEECNNQCKIQDMFIVTPFYKLGDTETEAPVKEQQFITRFKPKLNHLSLI